MRTVRMMVETNPRNKKMTTSTIETLEPVETKDKNPKVWHNFTKYEMLQKFKGLPYVSICGVVHKPNRDFKNLRKGEQLAPMEKCVICQTISSSQ